MRLYKTTRLQVGGGGVEDTRGDDEKVPTFEFACTFYATHSTFIG